MSHPFGDIVSRHLHRRQGLSQAKLAEGIVQPPTVITMMFHGQRLTGGQARERVLAILAAAGMTNLDPTYRAEADLLDALALEPLPQDRLHRIPVHDIMGQRTGTFTFLLTSIAAISRHWDRHSQAMKIVLARHDLLLRQAITSQHGFVFKTVGDAMAAAFVTPQDALRAAVAAQQALEAEVWGIVGIVRVRMAILTGTAEERDGDYQVLALARAAALRAVAHGGPILVSLTTEARVRDELPDGLGLVNLGLHRLTEMACPEPIFQLVSPDSP